MVSLGIEVQGGQGIYLPGPELWLDPPDGREQAFVSHAHSDHFSRSARVICSPATRLLMEKRYGGMIETEFITPGWRERVEWGAHEIMLLPAGHMLGSSMLHMRRKADGASLLYTGDFKLRRGFSSETADLEPADSLIMETTFGRPEFRFPPAAETVRRVSEFVHETIEEGGTPVLLGYSLGKAQEILSALGPVGVPVMLHESMVAMTHAYESLGRMMPRWTRYDPARAAGHVLLFPPSAARSRAIKTMKGVRTAMLSGWALQPGARFRYQVDEVFPLSDHADYPELLECVEKVNPRVVFTVHGFTADFARDLRARDRQAWSLVADDQLEFPLGEPAPMEVPPAGETPLAPAAPAYSADSFGAFVQAAELVAAHASRLEKRAILAAYLRNVSEQHLATVVRWLAGNLFDPADQSGAIQVGGAVIRNALMSGAKMREAEYRAIARAQNDTGRTALIVLRRANIAAVSSAELVEIGGFFSQLRDARGPAAKAEILRGVLANLPPEEGAWVVRLLSGDLRIGLREGLVEEAAAEAFDANPERFREAAMLTGDSGRAAVLAKRGELEGARPTMFVPIKVMLASPEETAAAIWERLGAADEGVWLEDKYDGIRAQIHATRERVEIFTRDLKKVTAQFPELAVLSDDFCGEWILDGEIIAFAEDKRLDFHDLQRRLGRKGQEDLFVSSDVTLRFVVFDLMYYDGRSLLGEPLHERRSILESLRLPGTWRRIERFVAHSAADIEEAFHVARRAGNEGLVAKDARAPYQPGRRGKSWLKLKKAFSTLDVVVVKAEQGHGKRSHLLSDYTFAVKADDGSLLTIGKAYSGLTDAEIEELTEHFTQRTISRRGNVRTVLPDIVLEVAFDSVRASARHPSGLALRFPRIKAIRRDKTPEEIDTLAYARLLAGIESV